MKIPKGKKVYFASDNHLGAPNLIESQKREKIFVKWLDKIKEDAHSIYLLGDLFDVWIEYKHVVPKGFVRVLGKLAELVDNGIPVYFFVGNHDMWMKGYFEKELGIKVFHKPEQIELNSKKILLGHGDGLGPNDNGYKRLKKAFKNKLLQFIFRLIHPDIGLSIAKFLSNKNRIIYSGKDKFCSNPDDEWLVEYCKKKLLNNNIDYFIFGHRHLPLEINLPKKSKYVNLGDWINYNSYASFSEDKITLSYWNK